MERERAEEGRILREERAGEGFNHEAQDGAQAEAVVGVSPVVFHHFCEAAGHELNVVHFIHVAHDIKLHTAAEGFNEVAGEAGAAAAQLVDDADTGLDTGGNALPLERMVEEAVAIVERHVERGLCFAALTSEEVLRGGSKVFSPEEASPLSF